MNDVPEFESLDQRYKTKVNPDQIERRKDTLRNLPVFPDLSTALGSDLERQYTARTAIEDPSVIHPSFKDLISENPTLKLYSTGEDGNLIMTSQINERLSAIIFLNPEMHLNTTDVALGMGYLERGETYDYLNSSRVILINQDGKAIQLDEYLPPHYRSGDRELRIVLNDRRRGTAKGSRMTVETQPLLTIHDLETFIHECGHMQAYNVNRFNTKYSGERDAAAFLVTAARELERKGFLSKEDVQNMIAIQRSNLEVYQKAEKGDNSNGVLAPQESFTQDATNISRFLESQRKKPPEERKTLTPRTEALIQDLKELVPKLTETGLQVRAKYDILNRERRKGLTTRKRVFFTQGNKLVRLDVLDVNRNGIDLLNLSEYSLDNNGDIHLKTYSVSSEEVRISEYINKKLASLRIDYDPVSMYSLKFDNPKNELDIKTDLVDKAKNVIINFLDNASSGQLETVLIDYERGYLEGQSLAT